jgi:hypothetical protein
MRRRPWVEPSLSPPADVVTELACQVVGASGRVPGWKEKIPNLTASVAPVPVGSGRPGQNAGIAGCFAFGKGTTRARESSAALGSCGCPSTSTCAEASTAPTARLTSSVPSAFDCACAERQTQNAPTKIIIAPQGFITTDRILLVHLFHSAEPLTYWPVRAWFGDVGSDRGCP